MVRRIVVVGGDAAGMSAASTAKRMLGEAAEVLVFERQRWTSYSACGIPYWLAGEVDGPDGLVARTPEQHRANGLDVRTGTEVVAVDLAASVVRTAEAEFAYDDLVIATGAVPIRPDLPGIDTPGVHGVQTLDSGLAVLDSLAARPQRAVVVGSGYIGIEMAEALHLRGLDVTVLDLAEEPMTSLDADLGALVRDGVEQLGIRFRGGRRVTGFEAGPDGRVAAVVAGSETFPADLVVLGLGVRPNTELVPELPKGRFGGLLTDASQRVEGCENVWAGGDCTEVVNRITGDLSYAPLGTHANKHGRVIGRNLGGAEASFPGIVGTAISRVCSLEIARTGLKTERARAAGFDPVSAVVRTSTRAGYFPGAERMTVKMIADADSRLVLGCQIVGGAGAAKRIDAAAVALWSDLDLEDVVGLDLAYAPPFSGVWDPIQVAARVLLGKF